MPFSVETVDQIHEKLLADFANRFPKASISKYSDNWKRLRVEALALAGLHYFAGVTVYNALLPDGATGTELDRHGTIHGITRKGATPAKKADALTLVGTSGSTFDTTYELTATDGTKFKLNESGSIPASGTIDVDVIGVDTGSRTRKKKGEVLTFVSAPPGIQSTAELAKDLDEDGEDAESDQAYRNRILDKISSPGMGGNANDYRAWALAVSGVASAYVYPGRNGLGSVDVAALHSGQGSSRALNSTERTTLKDYIDGKRPVSVKDFRILSTTAIDADVEMKIDVYDDAPYRFDWNDQTPPTVGAVDTTLRRITFSPSIPADLMVGDRVIYKSTGAPYGSGAELVVESLPGSNQAIFTAKSWPSSGPPVVGNTLYSGGPLVETIRAAILALINGFGPARGTAAPATMTWEDSLRLSALYRIGMGTLGVRETYIVTPGATQTPAHNEPNASIEYLIPRQIIVRKNW